MPILEEGQLKGEAWEKLAETIQQSHTVCLNVYVVSVLQDIWML